MPALNTDHYRGGYQVRARRLREAANADAGTTCWRCGRFAVPGDPWQAGHLVDGDPASQLLPEHRSCNAAAGRAAQLLRVNSFVRSRDW